MERYSAVDMIKKLVSFDTTSYLSNKALIDFISEYLQSYGIESTLLFNQEKDKANLMATIGPNVEGGVILSGHTDVVPVAGQAWSTNPFNAEVIGDKLYGRGTCDMKGYIGIVLSLVPYMLEKKLKHPIHLAFSYDEEIGCVGAPPMIDKMAAELPKIRAAIVGEPSSMQVVNAHKGILVVKTDVQGFEAHSSQPHRAVSAVMTAAHLIEFISDMMVENKLLADLDDNNSAMDPPYTTLTVGTVNGGTASNIIAKACSFKWDVRNIAKDNPRDFYNRFEQYCQEEVIPQMKAVSAQCDIVSEIISQTPAMGPELQGEAEKLCCGILNTAETTMVAYAAEAGLFQKKNISTVICGPGSIDQAHKPNEFIALSQIAEGEDFIKKLIDILS